MKRLFFFVLLGFFSNNALADAELSFTVPSPEVGTEQTVSISDVDQPQSLRLWVVYSPSSETQTEEEVGYFSEDGRVTWKPERPGIATLSVRDDADTTGVSSNVAVFYSSTPMSGVMVMLLAGALLFGGAGTSLRYSLRQ